MPPILSNCSTVGVPSWWSRAFGNITREWTRAFSAEHAAEIPERFPGYPAFFRASSVQRQMGLSIFRLSKNEWEMALWMVFHFLHPLYHLVFVTTEIMLWRKIVFRLHEASIAVKNIQPVNTIFKNLRALFVPG